MAKFKPKKEADYTVEEKVAVFDKLIEEAREYYEGIMSGEIHEDNDYAEYVFEDVVDLLGDGVWDVLNDRY